VRIKRPDHKNAKSIIEAAEKDLRFTLSLKITNNSSSTIIRNIYESFRMLGDAILVLKGIESQDHLAPINELLNLNIKTVRSLRTIDNLRRMRHNINYYGYSPSKEEAEDAISIVNACFFTILKKIRKDLED